MKTSSHLITVIGNEIIRSHESIEFGRANFRAMTGDIIVELDNGCDEILKLFIGCLSVGMPRLIIHEATIIYGGDDYSMNRKEIEGLTITEDLRIGVLKYYASCEALKINTIV